MNEAAKIYNRVKPNVKINVVETPWDGERFIELGKIVKQKTGVTMISFHANGCELLNIMLQGTGTWFFDA
jgi:hypothetical protein